MVEAPVDKEFPGDAVVRVFRRLWQVLPANPLFVLPTLTRSVSLTVMMRSIWSLARYSASKVMPLLALLVVGHQLQAGVGATRPAAAP